MNELLIICNPTAGEGRAKRRWARFADQLAKRQVPYRVVMTERPGHATRLALTAIADGIRHLAVFGGDGTLNEALQGLMIDIDPAPDVRLTLLEAGSCCDFAKLFPHRTHLDRLLSGEEFRIDVCRVDCRDSSGGPVSRYFLNNSSIGVISLANQKFNAHEGVIRVLKKLSVDAGAVASGLWALAKFKGVNASLTIDDQVAAEVRLSNLTVFKSPYFGGGMHYGTKTSLDDGRLYAAVIGATSRLKLAAMIPDLYTGKIFRREAARLETCRTLVLDSRDRAYVETDGELAGYTPARYTIRERALRVVM